MYTNSISLFRTIGAFLLGSIALSGTAKAQIVSHSKDVVIEQPANLPESAQEPGIAFYLNTESGDGRAYLYIEQQNGDRIAVLDVSDPGHVKLVRNVALSVPGPFEFSQEMGPSSILIRFKNNRGTAVLDFHKAKMPVVRTLGDQQFSGRVESLDRATYLMIDDRAFSLQSSPRDYQVIDTSNPRGSARLYTAKLVVDSVTRDETGTTFLLGSEGLTIIRHPQIEEEYAAEQRPTN